MEEFKLSEIVETRLMKVWKKYADASKYLPYFPTGVIPGCVLFLSLNPSLSKNEEEKKNMTWTMLDSNISFEENKAHKHFKKFFEIQNEIQEPWTFLDLLYIRDTDQEKVEQLYFNNRDFVLSQVNITLDLIKIVNPKLVIVANKFVDTILHENYQDKFNISKNDIYCFNEIPFVIRESRFMGSGTHWNNKALKQKMYSEIRRVLNIINQPRHNLT